MIVAPNFIFVHVPKTGGTSIWMTLNKMSAKRTAKSHMSAKELLETKTWPIWEQQKPFIFAFVRNPWDRAVSAYTSYTQDFKSHPSFGTRPAPTNPANSLSFREFLEQRWGIKDPWQNQFEWLVDNTGEIIVDYVGRFESLEKDMNHVQKIIKMYFELPRLNVTGHPPFLSFYDQHCIDLVAERSKEDIERFGYTKP